MPEACRKGSAATRLLKAMAGELRELAIETTRLGEALSGEPAVSVQAIELVQRFDIFVQNLQSHALLIDDLSIRFSDQHVDHAALISVIDRLPFFAMRQRLRRALSGTADDDGTPSEHLSGGHRS